MENMGKGDESCWRPWSLNTRPSSALCAHGSHLKITEKTPQHIDSAVWGQCTIALEAPLAMEGKKRILNFLNGKKILIHVSCINQDKFRH